MPAWRRAPAIGRPAANGAGRASSSRSRSATTSSRPDAEPRDRARSSTRTRSYRIDHYLGKETVQNLAVFRFGNGLFEPIWNRRYIDSVQITVAETVGVEGRGEFYDQTGALRDIVQNHALQLMAMFAMEPPVEFRARGPARREAEGPARGQARCRPRRWPTNVVRGQYVSGWVEGDKMPLLSRRAGGRARLGDRDVRRAEAGDRLLALGGRAVLPAHRQGAAEPGHRDRGPVQERAAGALRARRRPRSTRTCWPSGSSPDEGILLRFGAKVPGPGLQIRSVNMDFRYGSAFAVDSPDAYETLLLDAMVGDASLFTRNDEVERAWEILEPILDAWAAGEGGPLHFYGAGTWGRRRPMSSWSATADRGGGHERARTAAARPRRAGGPSPPHALRRGRDPGDAAVVEARHERAAIAAHLAWLWDAGRTTTAPLVTEKGLPHARASVLNLIVTVADEPSADRVVQTRCWTSASAIRRAPSCWSPSPARPGRRSTRGSARTATTGRRGDSVCYEEVVLTVRGEAARSPRRDRGAAPHPRPADPGLVAGRPAVRRSGLRPAGRDGRPGDHRQLRLQRPAGRLRRLANLRRAQRRRRPGLGAPRLVAGADRRSSSTRRASAATCRT